MGVIWRPLTCECIVEYDKNTRWVKTHRTCKLHGKFSGQKLLEEIRKHNKEISKIRGQGKPKGVIEGKASFEFSPKKENLDSLSFKIKQSEYILNKILKLNPLSHEFLFELDNFLASSQSILYYLLSKYAQKYGLEIRKIEKSMFKKLAEDQKNEKANNFIDWYMDTYKKSIVDDRRIYFLIGKRHAAIHKKAVQPDSGIMFTNSFTVNVGEVPTEIPLNPKSTKWFFNENPQDDIISLCNIFLNVIKKIVNDAEKF